MRVLLVRGIGRAEGGNRGASKKKRSGLCLVLHSRVRETGGGGEGRVGVGTITVETRMQAEAKIKGFRAQTSCSRMQGDCLLYLPE